MATEPGIRGNADKTVGGTAGASGHIHPGYAQHYVSANPPTNAEKGDLWSTGSLIDHPLTAISGQVDGRDVDDFPDFTTEPNPFYVTVELGQFPSEKAIITLEVGALTDIDLSANINVTVAASGHTWQWTFRRVEDVASQITAYEVLDPVELGDLTGTKTFTVTLDATYVEQLSVFNFYVSTSLSSISTSWWDGEGWLALSGSDQSVTEVFIGTTGPDPDAGIKLFVDVDDDAGFFPADKYPRTFIQTTDPATSNPDNLTVKDGDFWIVP